MINNIISEIFILISFILVMIIGYKDKIEEFNNITQRKLLGYLIIFSIIGYFFRIIFKYRLSFIWIIIINL